jgi:hypothetical protein
MKGEIYNFVLFSDIGTGSVADKSFFVDWNRLPESRYKLSFAFVSSTLTVSTTYEAMLYVNEIGCTNNIMCMGPYGSTAYNAGFIGILRDNVNQSYLGSSISDNPPSYLKCKPSNNQIHVHIHRNNASTTTSYSPLPEKYTLVLSFEQLDDNFNW